MLLQDGRLVGGGALNPTQTPWGAGGGLEEPSELWASRKARAGGREAAGWPGHFGNWRVHSQQTQSLAGRQRYSKPSSSEAVSGQLGSRPACAIPEEGGSLAESALA